MMGITATVFFLLLCQFGSSTQGCTECECCKNEQQICDLSKNCTYDCKAGYYGENCTEECLENCTTCVNGTECTECKPGYYSAKCNKPCGKGCDNNTCLISGECSCKSTNFINGTCENCSVNKYGDECNKTCPSNCSTCISDTKCILCLNSMFYGSRCQYSCSMGCKKGICNKDDGHCINGCKSGFYGDKCDTCLPGLYGKDCKLNCGKGCANNTCLISSGECPCKSTNFIKRKCDACSDDKYGDECNKTCPSNCGSCISDTECSWCKNTVYYGSYCQYRCSTGCDRGICNKGTGNCMKGCKPGYIGSKCDKCSPGLYGSFCDLNCKDTFLKCVLLDNCTECKPGFNGETCTAVKGAESDKKKSLIVIASSAGAGVAVIILLVILVICFIKRNRRQKLCSNTKCEENDYVLDMKEIPKQINEDEPGVIYAKPFKLKQEAGGDVGKEYDTAYDGDEIIPAIDNGFTAVNIGTSAKGKSFEVCDIAHDNKCNKPLTGNNDYAVVKKGKSTVKENECIEEMYDITHDNKKNKGHFNNSNDYAVLSVRSDNTESNLTQPDDVYDSAEGGKHKTMSHPSNDYAVFNSNNGDKHGNDKANTLYDTATDKKMRPGNNDYDFCELDTDLSLTNTLFT